MINTSNEFKSYILNNREFHINGTITLADATVINLTDQNVMSNGLEISEGTSDNGVFSLGSAIVSQCKITLNNSHGVFDEYEFIGAIIKPKVGLKLSSTIEYLSKGTFTVVRTSVIGSTIILYGYDNLDKLDRPFSEMSVSYPITIKTLLRDICTHCQIPYNDSSFFNDSFIVENSFDVSTTTCREVVSYIAEIACSYVKCNVNGYLILGWYNFSVFEDYANIDGGVFDNGTPSYASGDNIDGGDFTFGTTTYYDGGTFLEMSNYFHVFSLQSSDVAIDDVVITGVKVSAVLGDYDETETILVGTSDYVIEISENPLIQVGKANLVATTVGSKIIGMKFRPCDIKCISDPRLESGDVGYLSDSKGNSYQILATNIIYKLGDFEMLSCDAESPLEKNSKKYSESAKAVVEARKQTKQEVTNYDLTVQTMTEIITNGLGLYQTVVDTESGRIFYQHDKPTMNESLKRWFMTDQGYIQQTRPTIADAWVTTSGVDVYGNALYNILTVKGINADWINAGAITMYKDTLESPVIDITHNFTDTENFDEKHYENTKVLADGFKSIETVNDVSDEFLYTLITELSSRVGGVRLRLTDKDGGAYNADLTLSKLIFSETGPFTSGKTSTYGNNGMRICSTDTINGIQVGSDSLVATVQNGWTYKNIYFTEPQNASRTKVFLSHRILTSLQNIVVSNVTTNYFTVGVYSDDTHNAVGWEFKFDWLAISTGLILS